MHLLTDGVFVLVEPCLCLAFRLVYIKFFWSSGWQWIVGILSEGRATFARVIVSLLFNFCFSWEFYPCFMYRRSLWTTLANSLEFWSEILGPIWGLQPHVSCRFFVLWKLSKSVGRVLRFFIWIEFCLACVIDTFWLGFRLSRIWLLKSHIYVLDCPLCCRWSEC